MSLSAAHSPEERGHTLDQMLNSTVPFGFLFICAECEWFCQLEILKFQNLGVLTSLQVPSNQISTQIVKTGNHLNIRGWYVTC